MNTNPTSGPWEVEDGTFTVSAPDTLEHLPSHHCAVDGPDCGACPGDGSICKTSCKVMEESPPTCIKTRLRIFGDGGFPIAMQAANHIELLESRIATLESEAEQLRMSVHNARIEVTDVSKDAALYQEMRSVICDDTKMPPEEFDNRLAAAMKDQS